MTQQLIKGQKVALGKVSESFDVFMKIENEDSKSMDIDLMVFMMDEKNQVYKNNIVFYNQPYSILKSIYYDEDEKKIKINMDKIDEKIKKIVCVATIYEDSIKNKEWELSLKVQRDENIFYMNKSMDSKEYKSMVIGEIYLYKDLWKLSTILHESKEEIISCMKKFYNVHILD